jgi:shikimate kinase
VIVSKPIFLTGFMGVGKTKIGSILASRLSRTFIDTDNMIEAREGRPISRIFSEDGETYFRDLEHEYIREICNLTGSVVALGGGAVVESRNLELLCHNGVLVCIQATVDTILSRTDRRNDRPLLSGLDREAKREKICAMLADRAPFYQRAHLTIKSEKDSMPENTVTELICRLEQLFENN